MQHPNTATYQDPTRSYLREDASNIEYDSERWASTGSTDELSSMTTQHRKKTERGQLYQNQFYLYDVSTGREI
jgi:hypothetical protein